MEQETALEIELESQLSSLKRKGRVYFGACTFSMLPPFTRTVVEEVAYRIHKTCLEGYHVEELGFSSCAFGDGGMEALEEFLRHSRSAAWLESLVFSAVSNINNDDVARLVLACRDLRMLKISTVAPGTEVGYQPDVVGTGGGIVGLMNAAQRLEVLDLMGLESDQMDDFSHGLSHLHLLRELRVTMDNVSPGHLNRMLDALLGLSVDSLDIRIKNSIDSYSHRCLEKLTRLISRGDLKSLVLYDIPGLFSANKEALLLFLAELRFSPSLRRLELGHSVGISEDVAVSIFQSLEENFVLARFSWHTSCMLEKAWGGLLTSIPKMKHLSELTLSGSGTGDTVLPLNAKLKARLFFALQKNQSLTNFRYEKDYEVFATDRAEPLRALSRRNGYLRKAKAAIQYSLAREDDLLVTAAAAAHLNVNNNNNVAMWNDSCWPTLLAFWGDKKECSSAIYYIVQHRLVHWVEASSGVFKCSRKRRHVT